MVDVITQMPYDEYKQMQKDRVIAGIFLFIFFMAMIGLMGIFGIFWLVENWWIIIIIFAIICILAYLTQRKFGRRGIL